MKDISQMPLPEAVMYVRRLGRISFALACFAFALSLTGLVLNLSGAVGCLP